MASPCATPPLPVPDRFARLFPNAFTMTMASGIIAIDAHALGFPRLRWALFAVTIGSWLALLVAGAIRLARDAEGLGTSLRHHETGPGFLTLVAATAIVGSGFATFGVAAWIVLPLFALSALFWCVTEYGFLAGVIEGRVKPPLEAGLSGQWLLLVVATEALAALGTDIASPSHALIFACYAWALLGGIYYVLLSAMVLYRFTFVAMPPEDVSGPWWINAGAAAITVLAAAKLMTIGVTFGGFALRDLLAPVVVVFWADATFWIPLLLLLFAWKHVIRRRAFRYSIAQWSVVFPLGMYCAGTLALEAVFRLEFLHPLARAFFWIALLAWCAAFVGAVRATFSPDGTPTPAQG